VKEGGAGQRLSRITGEFVLIVVGVVVALMADDYRQQREVAASTAAAIDLLLVDLEQDSVQLAGVLFYRPGSNPNMGLLLSNTDRPTFPSDSAEAAIHQLRCAPLSTYSSSKIAFGSSVTSTYSRRSCCTTKSFRIG
jgi:hypothetical protein